MGDAAAPIASRRKRVVTEDFVRYSRLGDLGRWFINRFVQDVASTVEGRVLDAGAGECVYARFFERARYIGVDSGVGDAAWNYSNLDVMADLEELPFRSGSFDVVLSTQVLEHVEHPATTLAEAARLLRDGGRLFLTAPMSHPEHQQPHDFFRYTSYGLRKLLTDAGFAEIEIKPFGGLFVRWAYELPRAIGTIPGSGIFSGGLRLRGLFLLPLRWSLRLIVPPLQMTLIYLDRFDAQRIDPFGWSVVARKGALPSG